MTRPRLLSLALLGAALALGACGAGQDPALEVPSSTTAAGDATGTPSGAVTDEVTIENIELSGDAEVPGPGDDDGEGFANVFLEPGNGQICYDINVAGIDAASAAHIHEAGPEAAGPVVVPLEAPVIEGTGGAVEACVDTEAELIGRIEANPAGFYLNVHNEEFPDGALRGQLGTS